MSAKIPEWPARLLARYAPIRPLGEGGMGEVWAARDRLSARDVALKVLRADRRPDEARLKEEFALLASLDHPGVVHVLDVGVASGVLYMTSELVSGLRLDHYLERSPSPEAMTEVTWQLLEVLSWLHSEGVIHSDIKPANILLDLSDETLPKPILIDFGLARVEGGAAVPLGGTLSFMAPELLKGRWAQPNPRSDLYSLGKSLAPFCEFYPDHPLSALILRLAHREASLRPLDADEALRDPIFTTTGRTLTRRLGGRGLRALWGESPDALVTHLRASPGHHLVEHIAEDDGEALVLDIAAALEAHDIPTLRLSGDHVEGGGVALFERVAEAITGKDHSLATLEVVHPDDHKELLDTRAVSLIEALRASPGDPPVLLIPGVERLSEPGRYILARWIEAGVLPSLVLTQERGQKLSLGRGVEQSFLTTDIAAPDASALKTFLAEYGLVGAPPGRALALLQARSAIGAKGLRLLVRAWAQAGAIDYDDTLGWSWQSAVDLHDLDVPELGTLWRPLFDALPEQGRELIRHIHRLGAEVDLTQLVELPGAPYSRLIQGRLVEEGWLRSRARGLHLQPSAKHALNQGIVPLKASSRAEHRMYLALLEMHSESQESEEAKALHLEALERHLEAAEIWNTLAHQAEQKLDPGRAGRALRRAAEAYQSASAYEEAFERADEGARRLQVAGDTEGLDALMKIARDMQGATGLETLALKLALLEARVAINGSMPDKAIESVEIAEALMERLNQSHDLSLRFDLELARGTAHAQVGRREEALDFLGQAAEIASQLGDDHGEGRVTNNLGIAAFHARDFEAAAQAWKRSAEAKARSGDLRGRRISQSNRGLALRELGRFPEAIDAARSSLSDAKHIGDRRGEATGHLALVQLLLDVGDRYGARTHLESALAIPVASSMVNADRRILGVRLKLADKEVDEALSEALALVKEALDQGLQTIAREAWGLSYLAFIRSESATMESEVRAILGESPADKAFSMDPEGDPLVHAAWTHARAKSGEWRAVKETLDELVPSLSSPLKPGDFIASELYEGASELIGDAAHFKALKRLRRETLVARQKDALEILGSHRPSELSLARVFGMQKGEDGEISDLALQQTILHSEGEIAKQNKGLEWSFGESLSDPHKAAEKLARHLEAESLWLIALNASGALCDLNAKAYATRWDEVAKEVIVAAHPYFADAQEEGIAACGLPLRVHPDSPPVAALFLSWSSACPLDKEELTEELKLALSQLALSVDRRIKTRTLEGLTSKLMRLEKSHADLVHSQRQEITQLRDALHQSRSELSLRFDYRHIIHRSPGMQKVLRIIDKVSERDIPVLILGESGVGKEVAAKAIHSHSGRALGPFIAENCGAIPDELFESVFFGHVRGAFSGADRARDGLIKAAEGGTLFLDELGELPLHHQVKLLRVLQERRYRPVGSNEEFEANFRLIAATNRELQELVREGAFREDLYYRLAVVQLPIPPLRERKEDILPLAQMMLRAQSKSSGRTLKLSSGAIDALLAHRWPGNVRELDNEMLRASVLCEGDTISANHLSERLRGAPEAKGPSDLGDLWQVEQTLTEVVEQVEGEVIKKALERFKGQKAATARALGLSRPGLDGKLDRYGIDAGEFKTRARRARKGEKR